MITSYYDGTAITNLANLSNTIIVTASTSHGITKILERKRNIQVVQIIVI
jgi:hypothetical protein